jgi:plastocyanin
LAGVTGALVLGGVAVRGAEISGVVRYVGPVPEMRTLDMAQDPACEKGHTQPPQSESFVMGEGGTLGNVLVQVRAGGDAAGEHPVPSEPAVLDQLGCLYHPHLLVVRVGQPLKVLNSDDTFHNVHGAPRHNEAFNDAMPKFRKELIRTFTASEPEPFPVTCDVHPWMHSWIAVLDHPYFAVTAADGRYTLSGFPPGTYRVEAWHERLGRQSAEVTVGEGERVTHAILFTKP